MKKSPPRAAQGVVSALANREVAVLVASRPCTAGSCKRWLAVLAAIVWAAIVCTAAVGARDEVGRQAAQGRQEAEQPEAPTGDPPAPVAAVPEPPATPPRPSGAPPEPDAMAQEAVAQEAAQRSRKELLEVAQRLLKDLPNSADALGLMGMAHDRNGNSTEALQCWRKCLRLDPKRVDVYDAMAVIALKKGEYEEAAALSRKAIEIAPAMGGLRHHLGRALMGLGRIEEAIAALDEDIKISPGANRSYLLLGQSYLQLRDPEKARQSYEAATKIQPNDAEAYHGLAMACARLGQKEQAAEYVQKSQKLRDEFWVVHTDMRTRTRTVADMSTMQEAAAQTCADAGRIYSQHGYLRKAEKLWRRAAELDRKNTACRRALASLYQSTGRRQQALQTCRQLLEIEPNHPAHHLNTGYLSAALGQFDAAERAFAEVVRLAPQDATGYRALAGLYLNTGRKLAEAKQLAEKAVEQDPSAPNYFTLSVACEKNGDLPGALAAVERAIELDRNNAHYVRFRRQLQERK